MTEREMKIRVLSEAITDWQYGNESSKPERLERILWLIRTIARDEAEDLEAITFESEED